MKSKKALLKMKQKLQFKTMLKAVISFTFFFTGCLVSLAQGATFTSVDPVSDVLTITNTGSSMVDINNYWLCLGPGTYVRVGTVTPISGDYMLSPAESVTLTYNVTEAQDGLSLFSTNSFGSSDPNILVAFVQWGAGNQPRVGQAVTAGRWDNASNFVSGSGPYTTTNGGSAAAWSSCDAEGGMIQIAGTTDTSATICVGEGVDDLIDVEFVDMSVLSGDSSTWVITDQATGDILGAPATVPPGGFSLEGAPTGVCDIWYLRYTGDIGLGSATNVADLSGCFDLSNPISVSRNAVNGGAIQIAGTTDTTATICVGEGVDDLIDVEFVDMSVLSGDSSTWVITDQATGDILGAPATVPPGGFSLEGAPSGVCDIWYLRYTGDIGLGTATNVADLSGCFDLSNPISVSRNAVNGGAIQIAGTTDTTASICVGEGTDDLIDVEFVDTNILSGDSSIWVITDQATGDILGTPAAVPPGGFSLEGAPAGICDIWYLRYTGDIGLGTATNVADLSGCFDLSNPISVSRNAVNGGMIQIAGTTDTTATICVGEGVDDLIDVEFVDMSVLSGDSSTWVITDQATGDILGAPATVPPGGFNLEGAPTGVCDIWYLRYTGDIGLGTATNVADLSGCFDLSNPISVSRNAVNGGAIQIAGTTDTTASICVGEGTDDLIDVEFVDTNILSGDSSTWVITDQATGDILGTPAAVPPGGFSLEGAPAGICDIWYLRYTGDIGLGTATNVADLSGCFDLSNPISITRLTGTDCDALSIDEFETAFDFEVFPNPSKEKVNIAFNGNRTVAVEIQIINMLGQRVLSAKFENESRMTMDISNLENGTYFMNIIEQESGNRSVKRIMKN
ncbi:T9SS type A sorting domain-containing protein [Winogradskyella tangerina]|uniref:T9SS type A sorting domain-containing protein n=1 Tax=Winogradskyella tangerina TaxID=2023240 RepID=UPI00130068B8|nr:T9SS type A sorting domain-containing protein [Winogradskyella tangerina]